MTTISHDTPDFKIAKLNLKSGDVLCVKIGKNISQYEIDRLRDFLKIALPKNTKVILTDTDIDFSIITENMHNNIDNVSVQEKV